MKPFLQPLSVIVTCFFMFATIGREITYGWSNLLCTLVHGLSYRIVAHWLLL